MAKIREPKVIMIDDDFGLRADDYGYALIHIGIGKRKDTGVEFQNERVYGYFYSIQDAIDGYVKQFERETCAEQRIATLNDLMDSLSEKEKTLRESALNKVLGDFRGQNG